MAVVEGAFKLLSKIIEYSPEKSYSCDLSEFKDQFAIF